MKKYDDFAKEASRYKQILINYRDKGQVFTDNSFHPQGKVSENKINFSGSNYEWKRIDDVYNVPLFQKKLIDPDFIQQGEIGDCYFLTALAYIARKSETVKHLFDIETPESILGSEKDSINIKCGAVVIYFNVFGRRTPVLIDTYILFLKGRRLPRFGHPSDINQSPWLCLVEKAFAKLHGSFSNIISGGIGYAIYTLLGYYRKCELFSNIKGDKYEKMLEYQNNYVIMGTSSHEKDLVNVTVDDVTDKGIVLSHAYAIMKVRKCQGKNFICLRNPWGNDQEWLGDYSDTSSLWTPKLIQELGMKPSDDGTFWMIDRDFFNYFTDLEYSKSIPPNWIKRQYTCQLVPGPHDGYYPNCNAAKIWERPNFAFQITDQIKPGQNCKVRIVIEKKNPRGRNASFNYQVVLCKAQGQKLTPELVNYGYRYNANSNILSFSYTVNNNNEIITMAIQRTVKTDLTEDCYVQIFCELDFKLYNIDKPGQLIPRSENTTYLIDTNKDDSDDDNDNVQDSEDNSGLEFYKREAEKGDINAIYNYADILFYGDQTTPNKKEANRLYKIAADKGHVKSMHKYAWNLELGDGITENKKEALKYYKMAAENGKVKSMIKCAQMMYDGEGVPENKKLAIKYYKMAADKGDIYSMVTLGIVLSIDDDDLPANIKDSAKYNKMAADEGDVDAMFRYAEIMEDGDEDIDANPEEAAKYYKMAADKGDVESMKSYASMLDDGEGIDENKKEAAKYYSKAADEGDVQSMFFAATIYDDEDNGFGVDLRKSAKYYKMAADRGHRESMYFYGLKLLDGEGVGIDEEEGYKYIKKSADLGYDRAINYLNK
ncbi:hypothetical protein M9Y10_019385 [Tritrichomonas musculus]|uniref:Calpain catalytic domain-containing protein n=1 Tax=Tritrichomonas musculus TaxID=1915356 RepID=A0ABR2HJB1_9EUKA